MINKIIGKYCESINENNVLELLSDVDFNYIDDFFEFIDKYKIFNRISATIFKKILKMKETYLYYWIYVKFLDTKKFSILKFKPLLS